MRRISVDKLKPGMVLSKPIYTTTGVVLLRDGQKLTDKFIEKIQYLQLDFIYIKDEMSEGIYIDEIISEQMRYDTKKVLEDSIKKMRSGHFNTSEAIAKKVEEIIQEVISNPRVMVSVQEMRNKDEYLHMHAINVCVISILIGKKKGYNDAQLKHLALGAMLHDIGKIKIEFNCTRYREDYIDKEFNIYKEHVRIGYDLIKEIPNASLLAANIALTHHERFDGTGFPLGKKNENIHEFARIVAVANEYDNLLYNLPKEMTMRHYEIIEMIVSRAYSWFDPEIVKIFRNSISPYPMGAGVKLSDGRLGIVSRLNENLPTRPLIRIIDPNKTDQVLEEVDLSKNLSLMIEDEIDIDK